MKKLRVEHPDWHNGPVGALGDVDAHLLIVGLAPGRLGANRTGVPFVGDESSRWLMERLVAAGCMTHDGEPTGIRITNAVKCLPPGNRPTGPEIRTCSERWLIKELDAPEVRSVLALGGIAHKAVVRTLGGSVRNEPFSHGSHHTIRGVAVYGSYHPSPLNTRTGRLSPAAFSEVLHQAMKAAATAPQT